MTYPGKSKVAVRCQPDVVYPDPPYDPAEYYPEYPFSEPESSRRNDVYRMVRQLLHDLALDAKRYGTGEWNPLGELINPGAKVVIKPNLVLHRHPRGKNPLCLVTHGSIVRAVLDYVNIALGGQGKVIIADAPIQETDFEAVVKLAGIDRVVDFYRQNSDLEVEIVDLRQVRAVKDARGHVREWYHLPGDPQGYVEVDLGSESLLAPLENLAVRFRVANYPAHETRRYHGSGMHRYIISRTVLEADVVISLPKMKTHCKAGVTLGLKNLVGIVGRKECLAHHRKGSPLVGGDEYPRPNPLKALSDLLERAIDGNPHRVWRWFLETLYRVNERLIRVARSDGSRDGSWYGNDTVWRMVLDLNRIARYATAEGALSSTVQRQILTIVDGIIAGEGEGPLEPDPIAAGTVAAGLDTAALDIVLASLMGFDWTRIPLLRHAASTAGVSTCAEFILQAQSLEIPVLINGEEMTLAQATTESPVPRFSPPRGWRGVVELPCVRGSEVVRRESLPSGSM